MKRFGLRRSGMSKKPPDKAAVPIDKRSGDIVKQVVDAISAGNKTGNKNRPVQSKDTKGAVPLSPSRDALGLTARQGLFLRHYLISNNASDAARKAGYSKKGGDVTGRKLLRNATIAAEIRKRRAVATAKLDVTADRIVAELAKMGFANMENYMSVNADGAPVLDLRAVTSDQAAALQEVTVEEFTDGRSDKREVRRVKFKLADKQNALMLLGRNIGLFSEKVDHRHRVTLVSELLDEIDAAGRGARQIEAVAIPEGENGRAS